MSILPVGSIDTKKACVKRNSDIKIPVRIPDDIKSNDFLDEARITLNYIIAEKRRRRKRNLN